MQERRQKRRFQLELPCLLHLIGKDGPETSFNATTANIGLGGAYVRTARPLPRGTGLQVDILFNRDTARKGAMAGTCISLRAKVVRNDAGGMALAFHEAYQIMKIETIMGMGEVRARWIAENAPQGKTHALGENTAACAAL